MRGALPLGTDSVPTCGGIGGRVTVGGVRCAGGGLNLPRVIFPVEKTTHHHYTTIPRENFQDIHGLSRFSAPHNANDIWWSNTSRLQRCDTNPLVFC